MSNFVRLPGGARAVNMDLILSMEVVESGDGWELILYPDGDLCMSGGKFEDRTDAIAAMMRLGVWRNEKKEVRHEHSN